jgi:transcriptional regulator GlxA family with amidase domain
MRHNLDKKINRDEVARLAGMSPGHFSRMIKETTGKTFSDILTGYRVDRATDLLAHTDKSLVQIALECGFMDQSYFSRVFRKIHGRTPGEYRRRLQG